MMFLRRKKDRMFYRDGGEHVPLKNIEEATKYKFFVAASQDKMKLTEDHDIVDSYDVLIEVMKNYQARELALIGGHNEKRERIAELLKMVEDKDAIIERHKNEKVAELLKVIEDKNAIIERQKKLLDYHGI